MLKIYKGLIAFVLLCTSFMSCAALQIEITGGINAGRKIIVMPFSQPQGLDTDLSSVVSADLMRSGKFSPLTDSQIPANAVVDNKLNVASLAATGAEAIVLGKVYPEGTYYKIDYKIVGLQGQNQGKLIAHYRGDAPTNNLRQVAHRVSDKVYEHMLGQPGAFRTRIAYVLYRHNDKFPYQLMTADYDGFNEVPIVKSTQPIMTPN